MRREFAFALPGPSPVAEAPCQPLREREETGEIARCGRGPTAGARAAHPKSLPRSAAVTKQPELVIGIGGAAGDGVASAGNTLALSVARQGLGVYAYNAYQSVIRGGHSWLRLRVSSKKPLNHGDQVSAAIALNQDTMDRHLPELKPGGAVLFNTEKVKPGQAPPGVQVCPLPVPQLTPAYKELPIMQNTVAVGAVTALMGLEMGGLQSVIETTFAKKPKVVEVNANAAKAGFEYARANFKPIAPKLSRGSQKWA